MNRRAKLIVSGLLVGDREKVVEAAANQGLELEDEACEGGWFAAVLAAIH